MQKPRDENMIGVFKGHGSMSQVQGPGHCSELEIYFVCLEAIRGLS